MMLEMKPTTRGAVVTEPAPQIDPDPGAGSGTSVATPPHHDVFAPPSSTRSSGIRRLLPGGSGRGGGQRPTADGDDGGQGKLDLRNSWQVAAGSILIPLGVVFILLGWYGAAHARVVQQQIPYMVSGSFVGLGCMVIGGLLFWGHWLYRIWDQADLHHEEQQRVLEELVRLLATGAVAGGPVAEGGTAAAAAAARPASGAGTPGGGAYFATSSGTVYHQAGCPVIAHHPEDVRVLGPSGLAGLRPCQICLPD